MSDTKEKDIMVKIGRVRAFLSRYGKMILVGAVVVYVLSLTFFGDYNYFRAVRYDGEIRDLEARIETVRDSFRLYSRQLKGLRTDPESVEKVAREEFLMKRDNEDVYIMKEK